MGEPGHFVVAKGFDGNYITINDPYYDRQTLNEGYGNNFLSVNKLVKANSDLSYIIFYSNTPGIDINITDLNGNSLGQTVFQDQLINPLNNNAGGKAGKFIFLQKPPSGKYHVNVNSASPIRYGLKILAYDQNGDENSLDTNGFTGGKENEQLLINYDHSASKKTTFKKTKSSHFAANLIIFILQHIMP